MDWLTQLLMGSAAAAPGDLTFNQDPTPPPLPPSEPPYYRPGLTPPITGPNPIDPYPGIGPGKPGEKLAMGGMLGEVFEPRIAPPPNSSDPGIAPWGSSGGYGGGAPPPPAPIIAPPPQPLPLSGGLRSPLTPMPAPGMSPTGPGATPIPAPPAPGISTAPLAAAPTPPPTPAPPISTAPLTSIPTPSVGEVLAPHEPEGPPAPPKAPTVPTAQPTAQAANQSKLDMLAAALRGVQAPPRPDVVKPSTPHGPPIQHAQSAVGGNLATVLHALYPQIGVRPQTPLPSTLGQAVGTGRY